MSPPARCRRRVRLSAMQMPPSNRPRCRRCAMNAGTLRSGFSMAMYEQMASQSATVTRNDALPHGQVLADAPGRRAPATASATGTSRRRSARAPASAQRDEPSTLDDVRTCRSAGDDQCAAAGGNHRPGTGEVGALGEHEAPNTPIIATPSRATTPFATKRCRPSHRPRRPPGRRVPAPRRVRSAGSRPTSRRIASRRPSRSATHRATR